MRDAKRDEVRAVNAELFRDLVELAFLGQRDRPVHRRHRKQTPHQREFLVVCCQAGELPGDKIVGGASEQEVACLGQLHDDHRLVLGQMDLLPHERFHGAGFFRRYMLVGMGDPPKQIRKAAR